MASSSLLSSSSSSRSLSPPRKKRTAPTTTFSLSERQASFITSTVLASVQTWRFHSSRVNLTAQTALGEARSAVMRL
ncbi:hypothetical protein HYQ46_005221 [Verticillium longisporum]|nr:hypothetical protein HYQ46_005221 [Verticillium longisporum]